MREPELGWADGTTIGYSEAKTEWLQSVALGFEPTGESMLNISRVTGFPIDADFRRRYAAWLLQQRGC